MSLIEHTRLVTELCAVAGVTEVAAVLDSQHLAIGDRAIGLLCDAETEPDTLYMYFDLGDFRDVPIDVVRIKMLEDNLTISPTRLGCFGLVPGRHQAAYLVRLHRIRGLSGADLLDTINRTDAYLTSWKAHLSDDCQSLLTPRSAALQLPRRNPPMRPGPQ